NLWCQNCVALGPAAAALEPLEATDIFLIQKSLELLLTCFPDTTMNDALRRSYNQRLAGLYDKVRDFVLLHYLLSERDEGPFWRECRNLEVPDSLRTLMELHAENGIVEPGSVFTEASYHHLFTAAERLPRRPCAAAEAFNLDQVRGILQK